MDQPKDDDRSLRLMPPLADEIRAHAASLQRTPQDYLKLIFDKDKLLALDQGIVAISMVWVPLWLLFLALALSPQGADLLANLRSEGYAATATFFGTLLVLFVVATCVATALIAAWHFPRVAAVSMKREHLYVPKIPKLVPPLTPFETKKILNAARPPIVIAIGIPLALLSVAAWQPLEWQWGTALWFLVALFIFAVLIWFVAWLAVRGLFAIVVCSYLLLLLGLASLITLGFVPARTSHFLPTQITAALLAITWLLIFFGLTFQFYRVRHNPVLHKSPDWFARWIPRFVSHHSFLLAAILFCVLASVAIGFLVPRSHKWMAAADGGSVSASSAASNGERKPEVKLNDAFAQFNKLHRGDGRRAVVLVTAAGGGIRAAYWSAAVLTQLQDLRRDFDRHVFAISAVSGGALGTSAYKALTLQQSLDCGDAKTYRACSAQFLSGDFIGPNIISAISGEVLEFLSRGFLRFTARDDALEQAWSWQWWLLTGERGASFLGPFDDLFKSRPTPALLLNGTSMTSGRRVITSNLDVASFAFDSSLTARAGGCIVDEEIVNPTKYLKLSVSSAVLTSARFPYITPPGLLRLPPSPPGPDKCRNWEQIVDGGYIDNEGVLSMRDLLNSLIAGSGAPAFEVGAQAMENFKKAYRVVVIRLSAESSRKAQSYAPPARDEWDQVYTALNNQRAASGRL